MECGVDVLHKRNAVFGDVRNKLLQRIVVQTESRERNDIHVQIEFSSDALNKGRLPGSRSSILWDARASDWGMVLITT